MDFLKQIKRDIHPRNNSRRRHREPEKEVVHAKSLYELIARFEQLDADFRVSGLSKRPDHDYQLLDALIHKLWHDNGKNADQVMHVFSKSLAKLLDEKINNTPRFEPKHQTLNVQINGAKSCLTDEQFNELSEDIERLLK